MSTSIRRILFATDFSFYSHRAREYGIALVRKLDVPVEVVHAIETVYSIEDDPELREWLQDLKRDLKKDLDAEVKAFADEGVEATGVLLAGTPWQKIIERAAETGADLVICGSHGIRTREGRAILGTTSHKVILTSPVPVLMVPSRPQD